MVNLLCIRPLGYVELTKCVCYGIDVESCFFNREVRLQDRFLDSWNTYCASYRKLPRLIKHFPSFEDKFGKVGGGSIFAHSKIFSV